MSLRRVTQTGLSVEELSVVTGCLQELIAGRGAYGPVKLTNDKLPRTHCTLELM